MEISAYRNIPHYASAKPSYRHYSSYYFLMRRTSRIPLLQPLAPSSGTAFILRIVQAKPLSSPINLILSPQPSARIREITLHPSLPQPSPPPL